MRTPLRLCVAVGAMAITMVAVATTAYAAPPANDNFASPQVISALAPYAGTNVDSTTESTTSPTEAQRLQSLSGWGIFNTTWHEWEAPSTGDVTFVVCSSFATNVLVTSGSSVDTVNLASALVGPALRQGTTQAGPSDPSGCAEGQYHAVLGTFAVSAGTVLMPVIGSAFNGTTGSYTISTTFTAAPDNDDFANRFDLFSRHTQSGSNVAATTQVNEANNPYSNYRTVWYQFEAPGTDTVDIDLCSTFAANLVVYSGSALPLTPLQQAQGPTVDTCGTGKYRTQITGLAVSAGQVLKIQVGGYNGNEYTGTFDITASFNGTPPNDEWDDAIDLGNSDLLVVYGDNTNATVGLPLIGGQDPEGSVWYKWTAPHSGSVSVNACDGPPSSYDGHLAVFEETTSPPLVPADISQVALSDDGCTGNRPSMPALTFNATEAETYWIVFSLTLSEPAALFSEFTLWIDAGEPDSDGDGFADDIDDCPDDANEAPKTNGCPVEELTNTVPPAISGTVEYDQTLSTTNGTWTTPGLDPNVTAATYTYQWERCNSDASVCADISGADEQTYTLAQADIGEYLRVVVTAANEDDSTTAASSVVGPVPDPPDSDGDGVFDPFDDCINNPQGAGKTNGCPVEDVVITGPPTISGTAQVGSALTLSLGSAVNSPGIDPSVAAPTSGTIYWYSCSSATDLINCLVRPESSSTYTPVVADIGRYIRAEVEWDNSDGEVDSTPSVATALVVAAPVTPPPSGGTPPPSAPTDPLTLAVKKSLGTVKRDKKGVATLKGAVVTCGAAATAACTGTAAISAKVGKKTVKFGNVKISAAAGTTSPVKFKPSAKLAKAIKKAKGKKLKVMLVFSVSAPGFPAQTATATAVLK